MRLTQMHIVAVALLPVGIGHELTIVDLIRGVVLRLLRVRYLLGLLISGNDLIFRLLGGLLRSGGAGVGVRRRAGVIGGLHSLGAERDIVKIHLRPGACGSAGGSARGSVLGQSVDGESQGYRHNDDGDDDGHDLGLDLAEQCGIRHVGGIIFSRRILRCETWWYRCVAGCVGRVNGGTFGFQCALGFLAGLNDLTVGADDRNAPGLFQLGFRIGVIRYGIGGHRDGE